MPSRFWSKMSRFSNSHLGSTRSGVPRCAAHGLVLSDGRTCVQCRLIVRRRSLTFASLLAICVVAAAGWVTFRPVQVVREPGVVAAQARFPVGRGTALNTAEVRLNAVPADDSLAVAIETNAEDRVLGGTSFGGATLNAPRAPEPPRAFTEPEASAPDDPRDFELPEVARARR